MTEALVWIGSGIVIGAAGLAFGLLAALHYADQMNENGIAER